MARYMAIIDVTGEAFGALLKNPHDRKKAIEPFFSAIGGAVEHYWMGVGQNRLYIVINMPDNEIDMQAVSMMVFGSGIANAMDIVQLVTSEEAVPAMKRASELSYQSPTD